MLLEDNEPFSAAASKGRPPTHRVNVILRKRTAQELPEKQRKHKLREQREAARKDLPETAAAAKRAGRKVPVPSAAKRSAAGGGAKKRGLPRSMAR